MSSTVLFLCPHNIAKSVIAAAIFNHMAREAGLPWRADSAGTEPSGAIPPVVVAMLREEGTDGSHYQPRRVTGDELKTAARIVSMGCTAEELGVAPERVEQWIDVPAVSEDPQAAREAIHAYVAALVDSLAGKA